MTPSTGAAGSTPDVEQQQQQSSSSSTLLPHQPIQKNNNLAVHDQCQTHPTARRMTTAPTKTPYRLDQMEETMAAMETAMVAMTST
jgi:hypothetical protein